MQNPNHPNGYAPPTNGVPSHAQGSNDHSWIIRTPTVAEALPFTPFSSILPFNPEIILPPLATPYHNADYGLGDHQRSRQVLDKLIAGASSAEDASKRCQRTIRDVQKLLDAESLTKYHFKKPQHFQQRDPSNARPSQPAPALSPFAKMVLETADVPYRYMTPESPGTQPMSSVNGKKPSKLKAQKEVPTPQSTFKSPIHQPNNVPATEAPFQDPYAAPSSQVLQAVVPGTLSAAELAGIQYVPDTDAHSTGPPLKTTKKKSQQISVAQRQQEDALVVTLQNLLNHVISADDVFDPDEYNNNGPLTVAETADGLVSMLHPTMQDQLDKAILHVAKYSRLDDIQVDDLMRVQTLSERSVATANGVQLGIGEGWSEDDIGFWLQKIERADAALLAAKTLFRVMTAGRQEKRLQSEDHVRAVLELLRTIVDTAIVPIVEERSFAGEKARGGDKAQHNPKFVLATNHRTPLRSLLSGVTKCFGLLSKFLLLVDIDETAISSIVYMCKSLIFAENAATEKDSVFSLTSFETTRTCAMDVLGRIFTRYNDQRQFVIDEVLVSLEKLPATKQNARQYRIPDGKPIQLVSALLMRFVQTSAIKNGKTLHLKSQAENDDEDAEGSEEETEDDESNEDDEHGSSSAKARGASRSLSDLIKPLHDAAATNAQYIVRILINRASTTAKNSDEPYRKLMDIFTEDFLSVLGSSDWPAAEMLLVVLMRSFIGLAEDTKKPVPARNLSLELLGTMGSGILALQLQTRSAARNVDVGESTLVKSMVANFKYAEANNKDFDINELLSLSGPYRHVLAYLDDRDVSGNNTQIQTAKGFLLVQWANQLCIADASPMDSDNSIDPEIARDLKDKLRRAVIEPTWLETNYVEELKNLSTISGKFASLLVTTNLRFCKWFPRLFTTLANALLDEHTLVKSRAIKSIVTVVEKDPDALVRNAGLLSRIVSCMDDKSALVRESALGLVQKIMSLRPELATRVQASVHKRTSDVMPGVRKKAYKVLRDLYLSNDGPVKSSSLVDSQISVRANVANTLIQGMEDSDEGVLELVRAILEELWFSPFHGLSMDGDNAVQAKLKYRLQAQLLTRCISHAKSLGREVEVCAHMESLVRDVLTKSKTAPANERVCKTLVAVLYDGVIDPADIPGTPSAEVILMTLAIFAKACPNLMEAAQLERLEPFTNNLTQQDDLDVYRSVLTILRYAMPHVNNLSPTILAKIQHSLMKVISKLPRPELAAVAACLWTIDGELKNTERLVNLVASALNNISQMNKTDFSSDEKSAGRITKIMAIVGQFGKACDFEPQLSVFQAKLKKPSGKTVAGMAIAILCPFTTPARPLSVREAALDAICSIAQRWPKMFLRADVGNAFVMILDEKAKSLEEIFVSGLESFFATLSTPTESQEEEAAAPVTGRERLAKTYVSTDQDGASSELAQKFLSDIVRIAESSVDGLALMATKLIASILQQGLPHPKECGPTLVALETSPNSAIAQVAWREHKVMHQKHETTIEKEYVRSVQRSLGYQQKVVNDPPGFVGSPPRAKLYYFWDVLKSGKLKVRQKFITNIVQKLEFEPASLDASADIPPELCFARYVCENLALFEYDRIDDLQKLLFALEKSFSTVGTPVAQSIESEVLKLNVASMIAPDPMAIGTITGDNTDNSIKPDRLKTLALSAQTLLVVSETRNHILRLWNMQKWARNIKGAAAKENSKPPSRATNAPALTDAYIRSIAGLMTPATTSEQHHALCEQFVEVMNVDSEAKIPSEDEDEITVGGGERSGSEARSATPPAGKGRKRKSVGGIQTTPKKKKRKSSVSKSADGNEDGDWA